MAELTSTKNKVARHPKRRRVIFLDRDGVLNKDKGYLFKPNEFEFIDGVLTFLSKAQMRGYEFILITNQSGIGRGYFSEQDFLSLMTWVKRELANRGLKILDFFYCPHHPEFGIGKYKRNSFDRKPNPGMILKAIKRYDIDETQAILIGDRSSDILAGTRANVGRLYFLMSPEHKVEPRLRTICSEIKNFEAIGLN